ncbi:MAG: hypothetical protein ABFD20_02605 [Anaerolineales bacterium]
MRWQTILVTISVVIVLTGCVGGAGGVPGTLEYELPTTLTVPVGQALPGTDILYTAHGADGAHLLIAGQPALKRVGDTVQWSGEQVPGAQVTLKLRVAHISAESIRLVGSADLVLHNTQPVRGAPNSAASLHYAGPVAYRVRRGDVLPGTTFSYLGPSEQGALLGGIDEYPYRRMGDSIYWEGTLNEHASLHLDVRVVQYGDRTMRVAGTATIWLY